MSSFSVLALALVVAVVADSTLAQNTVCVETHNPDQEVKCEGGNWPTIPSAPPAIPGVVRDLQVTKVTIFLGSSGPSPFEKISITRLEFDEIVTRNDAGQPDRFPLRFMTKNLVLTALEELKVKDLKLDALNDDDLMEFTELRKLTLSNCNLVQISPKAFRPLITIQPDHEHFGKLQVLTIENDLLLKDFPWQLLDPVSETIAEITLYKNSRLETISYVPVTAEDMMLYKLMLLEIAETRVRGISQDIVETFNSRRATLVARKVHFINNQNRCESCQLASLIRWARAGSVAGVQRYLAVTALTCEADTGAGKLTDGNTAFWQTYPTECPGAGETITDKPTVPALTLPDETTTTPKAPESTTSPGGRTEAWTWCLLLGLGIAAAAGL